MPNLVESSLRRLQHQIGYNHAPDEAVQKRVRMEARHIHRHLKTDFLNYLKNITLMQTVTCKRLLMEAGAARSDGVMCAAGAARSGGVNCEYTAEPAVLPEGA